MKIAYTAWTWLMDETNNFEWMSPYHKRDFEQSLKDLHDCGYRYLENFNDIVKVYGDSTDEFAALMKKYDMEFVNLYNYFTDNYEYDLVNTKKCINFMKKLGIHFMNIQAPLKKQGVPVTGEDITELASKCNQIGKLCKEADIKLCFHPHYNTYIETEEQIDLLLKNTSREYVYLTLDTAHTTVCGMNPIEIFDKYLKMGIVKYIHLKDVSTDPGAHPEDPVRRFRALGYGIVDFQGLKKVIEKNGYDGILCVELDYQRVNNYDSAKCSMKYIHDVLGY